MSDRLLFIVAACFDFASGVALVTDGLIDLFETERALASLPATSSAPLGIFAITGTYLYLLRRHQSLHLDIGYALNVLGLTTVGATAFARNFVLAPLDDDLAKSIAMEAPTSVALILGGVFAVTGIAAFGSALIRSGDDRLGV